ncbi:hypothetical protein [Candidatus Palauibacter sp.]|uniref:hypothetical protein n=1 Tax=Candidatus Palauibacter sp. TaxID=3101350 RepID=UPI003AF2B817
MAKVTRELDRAGDELSRWLRKYAKELRRHHMARGLSEEEAAEEVRVTAARFSANAIGDAMLDPPGGARAG